MAKLPQQRRGETLGLGGVLAAAIPLRLCHALLIRTAFSPDEYWQCLEVAHRLVFGCACEGPAPSPHRTAGGADVCSMK